MKTLILVVLGLSAVLAFPFTKPVPSSVKGVIRGDIVLTEEQEALFFGKGIEGRTGLTDAYYRWPGNVVPYTFDGQNDAQRQLIRDSLNEMESKICVRFVEWSGQTDYVRITISESGCWSYVGRTGGAQQLNLDPDCYQKVVVQHEFIHALGFFHMQSAYERDDYVEILWQNILPGMEHNFDKVNPDSTSQFGYPYDLFSIMHYPGWAFAIDSQYPTMVARNPDISLDYRWDMTDTDVNRINQMYC